MYTIDDQKNDLLEDEYEDYTWDNRRGLIFKIIIIILCVIVLIWLIKALKSSRNTSDNGKIHLANVEKIRLAAEDYFFIKDNKNKVSYISLAGLKNEGLITDVVDANNKVCSDSGTNVNLDNETDAYKMTIKFSCSTNDKDEVFYYHKNTLACLNCTGKTNMNGTVVINDKEKTDNNNSNDNNNTVTPDDEEESEYSCINWSDWSKDRITDSSLTEKIKTLVTGVKYGKKTIYGDWSEYSTTPVLANEGVEVETKVVTDNVWSDVRTARSIDTNNSNIRIVSTETRNGSSKKCKDGYVSDNACYSNEVKVSNLTYKEYNSGNYNVKKEYCEGIKTLQDKDGLYVITYINCAYSEKLDYTPTNSTYTVYNYQVLEPQEVTYYRYRVVREVNEPNEYTSKKYEINNLPSGFVKLDGSEETYYSYKLSECVK